MKIRFWTSAVVLTVLTAFLCSCHSNSSAASEGVKLQGAGASFPAPLYTKWFKSYGAGSSRYRRWTINRSAAAAAKRA